MMKLKITKGPWKVSGNRIHGQSDEHTNGLKRNSQGISSASYSNEVCEMHGNIELPAPKANANLIAAAPDLLEACQNLVRGQLQHPTLESYVAHAIWVAQRAIDKAEGEK